MENHQPSNINEKMKPKGGIIAAFLGAMVTVMSVGVFHMIGHANPAFKTFLKLHEGVGPLSGKVVFSHILGFTVFGIAYFLLRKKQDINLTLWLILLLIALLLGSLFTFTPFVELVA